MMRLKRSSGVSEEVAPVRRGSIRRKVEVKEKPETQPKIIGMDFGTGDSTSFFTRIPIDARIIRDEDSLSPLMRGGHAIHRRRLANGIEYELTAEAVEDNLRVSSHSAVTSTQWAGLLGPVPDAYERNVDYDIATRTYRIHDTLIPGSRFDVEIDLCRLDEILTREHVLTSNIRELQNVDWVRYLNVPRGMRLVQTEQLFQRLAYRLTFEAPGRLSSTVPRSRPGL